MSSKASSDPVDLEKGVTGLRKEEEEEELPAVNPRKSTRIRLMDAVAVLHVLICVYVAARVIMVSNTLWDSLPAILILLPIVVVPVWLMAKMKEEVIQGHATEEGTLASHGDSDLCTKLLIASSNKN